MYSFYINIEINTFLIRRISFIHECILLADSVLKNQSYRCVISIFFRIIDMIHDH